MSQSRGIEITSFQDAKLVMKLTAKLLWRRGNKFVKLDLSYRLSWGAAGTRHIPGDSAIHKLLMLEANGGPR
jgi:hypothetical protein